MNTQGFFVGREYKKDGQKKDGSTYKLYKFKFKPYMDSEKGFTFSVFEPMSNKNQNAIQPNELKEGQYYRISYTESEFNLPDGTPAKSKTAIGFYSADPNASPSDQRAESRSVIQVTDEQFNEFKEKYAKLCKEKGTKPNVAQMLGLCIATYAGDKVEAIKNKCEEALR